MDFPVCLSHGTVLYFCLDAVAWGPPFSQRGNSGHYRFFKRKQGNKNFSALLIIARYSPYKYVDMFYLVLSRYIVTSG